MYKSLSKPSKTQQWYKVDGKYVLINTTNHKIVKVIG
ncbi:RcnB family protein [Acinetobacter sp. Marseille-Q1623]|nr:RcnB family protein [Acinetobacter sp. Marseille-Q1623]